MQDKKIEYQSGATVAQRAPIYIDVNRDPRARNQSYLNLYASRVGAQVVAVDVINGTVIASSNVDILNSATGSGVGGVSNTISASLPIPTPGVPPLPVTNLVATWDDQDNLVLNFTWNPSDPSNQYAYKFVIEVRDSTTNKYYVLNAGYGYTAQSFITPSSSSQTITISYSDLSSVIELISNINQVGVASADYAQTGDYVFADVPALVSHLPQPTISLSKGTDYYVVSVTNLSSALAKSNFYGIIVEENVTTETLKSNVSLTNGWVQASALTTTSPITIYAPDDAHRWVRVKFVGKSGMPSVYSDIADITPDAFIPVNTNPPTQFASASIAWSSNDIVVTFAQPASNAGTTVKVKMVPYINGSESNSLYAFYYHVIVGSETSFNITSGDLYNQFGAYYSTYKAYITSVSNQGIETTDAVIIAGPATRTTSLSTVTPTASVTNTTDGYVVQFDLGSSGANFGEVYQFYISPTFTSIDLPDYMDATYSSSGTNTIVVSSITLENGDYSLPSGHTVNEFIGTGITGNGIQPNTYVTNISGTGPYTLTLSQNIDSINYGTPSGNYHMQSLVYSGKGPANIFSTYYNDMYVTVFYYDNYDNRSQSSNIKTVHPINPAESLITNAVQVGGTAGAIYVGSSASTGARILLGVDSYYNSNNSHSGIFAYDGSATTGSSPTTSIISNASNGGFTFSTINAKIADWTISSDKIQNTLDTVSNYVGMSGTGTYSFWAGSATSGGDSSAKFSVTPAGKVSARDITIYGSGNNSDTLISAGSYFSVKGDGSITASNASISGALTVSQQSYFNADVNISSGSYLNSVGTGTVRIGAQGLLALDTSSAATTKIYSSPITVNGTSGISLWSKRALFGSNESSGWLISDGVIQSDYITMDSSNHYIKIVSQTSNSTNGIQLSAGADSDYAIKAGNLSGTPDFWVKHDGSLKASNATITGTVSSSIVRGGKNSVDDGNSGYYLDASGSAALISYNTSSLGGDRYYSSQIWGIKIGQSSAGTRISGIPIQGDADLNNWTNGATIYPANGEPYFLSDGSTVRYGTGSVSVTATGHYKNAGSGSTGLGDKPRQRMIIEDPVTGELQLGMAVYYRNAGSSGTAPTNSGYVGDLWVDY